MISTSTQLCAVIGNPVEHSLSPLMHNAAFEAAGLDYVYLAFHVEDVGPCLTGMRAMPSFRGMSVTIPHKVSVMEWLDEIDPMARRVGCVNTIVNEGGRLKGTTTDGIGALRAFEEAGIALEGKRVLFAGSGGAVRSVAFAMLDRANVAGITVLGRAKQRLDDLVSDLRGAAGATAVEAGLLAEDLEAAAAEHDVIVQGTPLGMYPQWMEETAVPRAFLEQRHAVFDMVYRPYKTRLIQEAEEIGCRVIVGAEMLVNQAVFQFEAWTGCDAPLAVMRDALVNELMMAPENASAVR